MNIKKFIGILALSSIITISTINYKVYGYESRLESDNVIIKNLTEKNNFKIGENANIKFELINNTNENKDVNFFIKIVDGKDKTLKSVSLKKEIDKLENEYVYSKVKISDNKSKKIIVYGEVNNKRINEIEIPIGEINIGDSKAIFKDGKTINSKRIEILLNDKIKLNNINESDFEFLESENKVNSAILKNNKIVLDILSDIKKSEKVKLKYKNNEEITIENNLKNITVMLYFDGDNNLESEMLKDIEEIKKGIKDNVNLNVIALVDRIKGYSEDSKVLGENFESTRLYKIENNKVIRLDGKEQMPQIKIDSDYEANMGDAKTLRSFIDFCKSNYSADSYILIPFNHGEGNRGFCIDETDKDILNIAEVSDNLSEKQSVDMIIYEACFMGNLETAYQYRPNNGSFESKYMIASSATMLSSGFNYEKIFNEWTTTYDPSTMTMNDIGSIFIKQHKEYTKKKRDQVLAYYDLNKVGKIKNNVDQLSRLLAKENKKELIDELRGNFKKSGQVISYFNNEEDYVYNEKDGWKLYPYFDLYDLCEKIIASNECSDELNVVCENTKKSLNEFIIYSFGQSKYKTNGFKDNINGVSIFLPDGESTWKNQSWYSSEYIYGGDYGALSWCKDGIDPKINVVGNWFEMLDSWFDKENCADGGENFHQW